MQISKLNRFMVERDKIRMAKEAGKPKPWTKDPILQQFRFCNVRREDDAVTKWIRENWRTPYENHPNIFIAMILARMINFPECLAEIGFPTKWNPELYLAMLKSRKVRGEQLWNGAYMVTAGGKPIPKEEAVVDIVDRFHRNLYRPKRGDRLEDTYEDILDSGISGIGTFLAGQFIADLKHTPALVHAEDWWQFCTPGPGSTNGLNIVAGYPEGTQWNQYRFQKHVNLIRLELRKKGWDLDAHDVQNCLCEYSKYYRGYSKSHYPGLK